MISFGFLWNVAPTLLPPHLPPRQKKHLKGVSCSFSPRVYWRNVSYIFVVAVVWTVIPRIKLFYMLSSAWYLTSYWRYYRSSKSVFFSFFQLFTTVANWLCQRDHVFPMGISEIFRQHILFRLNLSVLFNAEKRIFQISDFTFSLPFPRYIV